MKKLPAILVMLVFACAVFAECSACAGKGTVVSVGEAANITSTGGTAPTIGSETGAGVSIEVIPNVEATSTKGVEVTKDEANQTVVTVTKEGSVTIAPTATSGGAGQATNVTVQVQADGKKVEIMTSTASNNVTIIMPSASGSGAGFSVTTTERVQVKEGRIYLANTTKPVQVSLPEIISAQTQATVQNVELAVVGSEPQYTMELQKEYRVLALIPVPTSVQVRVNAADGTVTGLEQPWYAFLSTETVQLQAGQKIG